MNIKIIENKIYFFYVLIGLFYITSKVIFYFFGFVCLVGVMLGLTATVLTTFSGIDAFKEYNEKINKPLAHWLAIIFPLIILICTPLYMVIRLGVPVFQFPMEKFAIFLIFECLATAQFILAALALKYLRRKR